jgi:NAD(P)-dependent dehydrogenase (short-subunit alcohol dehydrogenase family)
MSLTAAVTGGNRGLGLEIVKHLAESSQYQKVFAMCRKSSNGLNDLQEMLKGKCEIVVVESIDVSKDEVATTIQEKLSGNKIDLLINNAGGYDSDPTKHGSIQEFFQSQKLEKLKMADMQECFEINSLGPLRVTQALLSSKALEEGSKVVVISSLMGSINDNTSGGHYAYRASKAAANMIFKSLSVDLKAQGIVVGIIHPGMVETGFTGGHAVNGTHSVESSTLGVLQAVDSLNLENTGSFIHGNYGEGLKPCPW